MKAIIAKCQQCGTKNKIPVLKQHLKPKCARCGNFIDITTLVEPISLSDADLTAFVREAPLPVMVDFYSPSCGPCRTLAPTIDKIAKMFRTQLFVAKIDTSRNQQAAVRYNIRGVPTLLFFKKGRLVDQIVGAVPESQLSLKIQTLIST